MSGNAEEGVSVGPETELLLFNRTRPGDTPTGDACLKAQLGERRPTDEPYHRGDVSSSSPSSSSSSSSSRPTSQDKYMRSSRNAQVEEPPNNSGAAITQPSITVNDAVENDDPPPYVAIPPPYSAIAPPNHVGWPYGPFSFDNTYSTDASSYTVEMPLAPFQSSRAPTATAFHPEETNRQHVSLPMPLTPYRFFKFGYRGRLGRWLSDNRISEKIEDRGSRKCGAILMAATVIISLMALSLMVRFIMEKSLWRG